MGRNTSRGHSAGGVLIDEAYLEHWGILGMKWGVRRDDDPTTGRVGDTPAAKRSAAARIKSGIDGVKKAKETFDKLPVAPSKDAQQARTSLKRAKTFGVETLSNAQINHAVKRMDLEKKFKETYESQYLLGKGKQFAKKWFKEFSLRTASSAAASWVSNPFNVNTGWGAPMSTWGTADIVRNTIESSGQRELER